MTVSPLALGAKKVIDAAWLHGGAYDLSSQAAFALESAQMLQSPETAAEMTELRRQLDSAPVDGQRLIRSEQRTAELEAVLGTHRRDDQDTIERLRARVAELEAVLTAERARHVEYEDSSHCQLDGEFWPCRTVAALTLGADGITQRIAPTQALRDPRGCSACGALPEQWCPDCAACKAGCFGGFDGNECSHANASWGGAR